MRRRKGFTLIELLVVVAIIAILASLLLPALARARSQAKVAKCASQQKQFFLANSNYADDNEDYGFYGLYAPQPHALYGSDVWWDYLSDPKRMLSCPGQANGVEDYYKIGVAYGGGFNLSSYFFPWATGNYYAVNAYYQLGGWYNITTTAPTAANRTTRNCAANRRWLGSFQRTYTVHPSTFNVYYAWYNEPDILAAMTDAFDPSDGIWGSSWLGKYENAGKNPNNHLDLGGENITYMDGHLAWKNGTNTIVLNHWSGIYY